VCDRCFFVHRLEVGELQPEAHHLFVAGFAPTNRFGWIGVLHIVERIVEICGGHQLCALGQNELVLQEVSLLPPEVVMRNIKNHFVAAIGKDGFGRYAFPTKVHVSGVGQGDHILRQGVTGGHSVIFVPRGNEEKVIPDFVLGNLVLYRFLGNTKPMLVLSFTSSPVWLL
jgi:hypothetical protein